MADFIMPVEGWITCSFECHRKRTAGRIFGVDIGVSYLAWDFSADGRVTFAGWAGDAGLMIEQSFRDRYGGEGFIRYLHLNSVAVGLGAVVKQGQHGGLTGNSGNTTGPHMHVDFRYKERAAARWIMEPYWDADPAGYNVDPLLAVLKSQQQEDDEDMIMIRCTDTGRVWLIAAGDQGEYRKHISPGELKGLTTAGVRISTIPAEAPITGIPVFVKK